MSSLSLPLQPNHALIIIFLVNYLHIPTDPSAISLGSVHIHSPHTHTLIMPITWWISQPLWVYGDFPDVNLVSSLASLFLTPWLIAWLFKMVSCATSPQLNHLDNFHSFCKTSQEFSKSRSQSSQTLRGSIIYCTAAIAPLIFVIFICIMLVFFTGLWTLESRKMIFTQLSVLERQQLYINTLYSCTQCSVST